MVKQILEYIKKYNEKKSKPFIWTYDPFKLYNKVS